MSEQNWVAALEPTTYCVNPAGAFEASRERLDSAAAQVFGLTREGDAICLPVEFQEIFGTAADHLRNGGMNPTTNVIWHLNPSAEEIGSRTLVPHTHSNRSHNPAAAAVRDAAGDKDRTPAWMSEVGLRHLMPQTTVLRPGEQFDADRWGNQRAMVKRCRESSGAAAILNVVGPLAVPMIGNEVAKLHDRGEPAQIQAVVPENGDGWDGSAQFFAFDGENGAELKLLGMTRQLVDPVDNHHFGNEAPVHIDRRFEDALTEVALALFNRGLRGFFGVDFRVSVNGGDFWVTEFNLRINGSSAPLMIMLLLGKSNMCFMREIQVHEDHSLKHALELVERAGGVAYHFGFWQTQRRLGVVMFDDDAKPRLQELKARLTLNA